MARIAGVKEGVAVGGVVTLEDTPHGLKIDAEITQAPPGPHAFHIHEFGACEDSGNAAGSHFNPGGHPHGNVMEMGVGNAHAGDFGNVEIGEDGHGSFHAVVPGLAISRGKYNVAGRAFILHAGKDDFSQPVGNAGARIGCGPVLIVKE